MIVCGMGKAGLVGQKIMATLASTGTPSHCLHPAEAVHGDLGRVRRDDVMLILSQSGETEEIVRLLPSLAEFGVPMVAITGQAASTLGRAPRSPSISARWKKPARWAWPPAPAPPPCWPSAMRWRWWSAGCAASAAKTSPASIPAGSLGYKLSKVEDHMRPLEHCRVAAEAQTVREVLVAASLPGRRTGATMLVDQAGQAGRHLYR